MRRRDFLASSAGAAVTLATRSVSATSTSATSGRFRLNFAPHLGTFRNLAGDDPVDQIRFIADEGFQTFEDVGLRFRSRAWRRQVARELSRRDLTMGAFEAVADFRQATFTTGRRDVGTMVLREMQLALDVAGRMNSGWVTVMPGKIDSRQPIPQQTAQAVGLLRRCADLCAKQDCVMLLEPLNRPGLFLQTTAQAAEICRAVASPACKILYDIADRPLSAGALLADVDAYWYEIAYIRLGDFPGRKEPGTGMIDFRSVFRHLRAKGFDGVLGMDHGNLLPGEAGELRVLSAYVAHDVGL